MFLFHQRFANDPQLANVIEDFFTFICVDLSQFYVLNARVACIFRVKKCVEINFLCVHKKLREKRVAPVLIREITRRVNLQGIFQAVYTAGVVLPKPVSACR